MIYIIMHLSLIRKYNKNTIDINIWQQSNIFTFLPKNCDFDVKIVTYAAKLVFFFINFIKHNEFF